jgi:uncharacterized protein (DUF1499 family)
MAIAWLAFLDSLMAVSLIAAGVIGAHYRIFGRQLLFPYGGFQMLLMGFFLGFVAFLMGLIGIFATRKSLNPSARARAKVGTVIGLLVFVPALLLVFTGPKVPAINDITTDFDHPPEFTHALEINQNYGRDMKYDRAKYADRQLRGYGPLGPLKLPAPPDEAFKTVQQTAAQMPTWTITMTDPATHTLEGFSISSLFHFRDDFVIQVRPDAGSGSLVEMRSKSRDGVGDFGVNYKRIKGFFAAISPSASS